MLSTRSDRQAMVTSTNENVEAPTQFFNLSSSQPEFAKHLNCQVDDCHACHLRHRNATKRCEGIDRLAWLDAKLALVMRQACKRLLVCKIRIGKGFYVDLMQ